MIIYELNARVHAKAFDQISEVYLRELVDTGFDWIWLMGIYTESPAAKEVFRKTAPDFEASPYALLDYSINPKLGGEEAFKVLVERAHNVGLKVMADFVPNHMAIDSPLIDEHPEYFIFSNPELRDEAPSDYFTHRGARIAHGRDPYFAGWPDTAQLDYTNERLRRHQIGVLLRLAGLVDGLRCDMAMLVLRQQIKSQWFPRASWEEFDRRMPGEFWSEAIAEVRRVRPDFVFMAEVYWDKEAELQALGFDLTYNKRLYDLLAHMSPPEGVSSYLKSTPHYYLGRCVHFLENHDEERARTMFGSRARPAAVLSYLIPGVPFVHDGQMEGFSERLPVQRVRPLKRENPDLELKRFYGRLLQIARDPLYRAGGMLTLWPRSGLVIIARRLGDRVAMVGVDLSASMPESPEVALPFDIIGASFDEWVKNPVDRWNGQPVEVERVWHDLRLRAGLFKSWTETHSFILEFEVG